VDGDERRLPARRHETVEATAWSLTALSLASDSRAVLTEGRGRAQLHEFYRDQFIPPWPDDVELEPVSRTVDDERVVFECIVRFTHTREMPYWLPGVPPSGRRVELPHVVIMGFEGDKVAYEHIYWDQASLLVQVGVLDAGDMPVIGADQGRALVDPSVPVNGIISASA
jgi:carboxymethylenebutenolidase